jgi:hypothetical protein
MDQGQLVLGPVQRALRVDQRFEVQDPAWAYGQLDEQASPPHGGKIAEALRLCR